MSSTDLVPYAAPALSPEAAEQRAELIRTEIDRRPDDTVIRAWLQYVAAAVARPHPTADEIVMLTGVLLDGEYPAAVFNATTRREAAREFKHWPAAAEIWDLMKPHIEAMGIELPGLDRIVRKAKQPPVVPAREVVGYDAGPAFTRPSQQGRQPAAGLTAIAKRQTVEKDDAEQQQWADKSQHEQLKRLAAMGIDINRKPAATQQLEERKELETVR